MDPILTIRGTKDLIRHRNMISFPASQTNKGPWDPKGMNSPPSPPNSGNPVTMVFHIGGQQRQDRRVPQGKPTLGACHRKGGNSEKTWKGNQTTKNLSTKRYLRVQGPTKA